MTELRLLRKSRREEAAQLRAALALEEKKKSTAGLIVAFWLIFLLLVALTSSRWDDFKGTYLLGSSQLQKAPGVIVVSRVFTKRSTKGGTSTHYGIGYRFRLENRDYYSDKITFSHTGTKDGNHAASYVKKYPVGAAVTVYYEKGNPSFSVLEPEAKDYGLGWLMLLLFAVSGVPALGLSYLKIREKLREVRDK